MQPDFTPEEILSLGLKNRTIKGDDQKRDSQYYIRLNRTSISGKINKQTISRSDVLTLERKIVNQFST